MQQQAAPNLNHYRAYSMATQTVAKTKQVVMLYDGAIRFIKQAKEAIHEKRIEDRYNLLMRASEIVLGLQGCLDFENGGDIARILYDYYSSMDARLLSVHRTNSIETCDQILKDLKEMRDVWSQIDQNDAASATTVAVAAADGAPVSAPRSATGGGVAVSA